MDDYNSDSMWVDGLFEENPEIRSPTFVKERLYFREIRESYLVARPICKYLRRCNNVTSLTCLAKYNIASGNLIHNLPPLFSNA